ITRVYAWPATNRATPLNVDTDNWPLGPLWVQKRTLGLASRTSAKCHWRTCPAGAEKVRPLPTRTDPQAELPQLQVVSMKGKWIHWQSRLLLRFADGNLAVGGIVTAIVGLIMNAMAKR